jgi:IMP dehydrogenase
MNRQTYSYSYDDIFLTPQYSEMNSRSSADTSTQLGDFHLRTPIMSANMDTITGSKMAIAMYNAGGIGSLHRFMSIKENIDEYGLVRVGGADCFLSVGVNDHSRERFDALYSSGGRHFVIDIAHGHSVMMKNMLKWIKSNYSDAFIMSGNVATPQAVKDLHDWGANSIKVGISNGSCCSTNIVTGHGVPQFSAVLDCSYAADQCGAHIVADGGIKTSGDIVKAFAAGCDLVMIGSLLSGTDETPGKVIETRNGKVKEYRGMASSAAMSNRPGQSNSYTPTAEGVKALVPAKGSALDIVNDLTKGLKSGMSYCNAFSVSDINVKSKWGIRTMSGLNDGKPHILGSIT